MRKSRLAVASGIFITISFLASNYYQHDAQEDTSRNEKATILKRSKPATDDEREYSKEFRKLYPDAENRVERLLELARKRGNKEVVGSSYGEPSVPSVGGFGPASESESLAELFCKSDFIGVGQVNSKVAHLTDDKSFVYTQYQFVLTDILKNNARNPASVGDDLQFTRPGGFISIDNQLIKIEDKSYLPLNVGDTYLVFLKFVPGAKGFITSTVEGTFNLSNGVVAQLNGRGVTSKQSPEELFAVIRAVDPEGCKKRGEVKDAN